MNFSEIISFGMLSGYLVLPVIAAIVAIFFLVLRPDFLFLAFVAVIVFFNSQTSGAIGADANTIYYRGAGFFFLPLVTWVVIAGFSTVPIVGWINPKVGTLQSPVNKIYWAILALCLCHLLTGFALDVSTQQLISNNGLFPLFLSSLFFLWGGRMPCDPKRLRIFMDLLLGAIFIRCLFGLGRYVAFGGDPVNIYENIERLGTKVVFFDFHDSTLATLLVIFSLSRLLIDRPSAFFARVFFNSSIILGGLVIVLSQHRVSLIGLFIGGLVLVAAVRKQQRYPLLAGLGLAAFLGFVSITAYRLSKIKSAGTGISSLVYDFMVKSGGYGPESARTLEQKQAFSTFIDNPVLGVGSWGKYQGFGIGWQDLVGAGAYETVHNGFLQMAFKSGSLGLILICLLFIFHTTACVHMLKKSASWYRCAHVAAFGTFIAMLPNFAIGMVMAQQRGLFLLALLILLPYAIRHAEEADSGLAPGADKKRNQLNHQAFAFTHRPMSLGSRPL